MSFRSLDLEKYHLRGASFLKTVGEKVVRDIQAIVGDAEPEEELHVHGHHPYTISGSHYWAEIHLGRLREADEDDELAYGFDITLWTGEPEDPPGPKFIRDDVREIVERIGEAGDEEYASVLTFVFPREEYHSPLLTSEPAPELDEATTELPEEYTLHPSGARFASESGNLDIILDTTSGPISVRIHDLVKGKLSLEVMRETIRNLHEIADLFVDRRPEGVNGN